MCTGLTVCNWMKLLESSLELPYVHLFHVQENQLIRLDLAITRTRSGEREEDLKTHKENGKGLEKKVE